MKKRLFIFIGFVLLAEFAQAQSVDMYLGNKAMETGDLDKAEMLYNKALEKQSNLFEGQYNLGNVAYKKGDYETAANQFQQAVSLAQTNEQRAKAYHNLGNSQLQSKKYEESIKSYKESLKLNPQDDETRYNLAYAQKMLKQQQQQNQDQNKDQDKQDQENKDQEKQEQKDQDKNSENKDNKDKQEQEEKEKQESKDGNENKQEDGDQKQPKPVNLSPREAEQLLEAAKEEDQKLQMQMHKQPKKSNPKIIDKDW